MRARRAWMMTAVAAAAGLVVALGVGAAGGAVQGGAAPTSVGPEVRSVRGVEAWTAKLSLLEPGRPEGYFLLAEEVMAEWPDREGRVLARTLLVLSLHLERLKGRGAIEGEGGLGPISGSACLALAAMEPREDVQRWLVSMASLIDNGRAGESGPGGVRRVVRTVEPVSWRTALDAAEVLQWARAGEGRRAQQLLDRTGVRELLEDYQAGLDTERKVSGMTRVLQAMADWPGGCDRCRSTRFVAVAPGPGQLQRGAAKLALCDKCAGLPGPKLTPAELMADLRLESMLLRGVQRSWSAQLLVDGGRPMLEPEPGAVARYYMVETERTVWREGRWVEP